MAERPRSQSASTSTSPTHDTADDNNSSPGFSISVLSHLKRLYQSLSTPELREQFVSATQFDEDPAAPTGLRAQNDSFASFDAFLKYISGQTGNAEKPLKEDSLSFPIAEYFISTSHNTYLTGNQLYSDSSTDPYKNVLLRGCRCLEIDVWDGLHPTYTQIEAASDDADTYPQITDKLHSVPVVTGGAPREENGSTMRRHPTRMGSLSNHFSQLMRHSTFPRAKGSEDRLTSTEDSSAAFGEGGKATSRIEPRVLHGHTLTKEVPFRDVCYAIRDSAFVTSHLPVIISLEVHANLEQQEIMVEIMREAWEGHLIDLTADLDTRDCKPPCLIDLHRKILIKVKWAPPTTSTATEEVASVADVPLEQISTTSSIHESQGGSDETKTSSSSPAKKPKSCGIANALSRLAVYTRAYHFSGFSQPEATITTHVFSLSESAIRHARESDGKALRAHNRKYLMRVFPSGMRVKSSNLDPSSCWQVGAQMVALNWQRYDKGMMLNHAMFAGTGGWALKPKFYRDLTNADDNFPSRPVDVDCGVYDKFDFAIDVLAGQHVPLPSKELSANTFRPYVKCRLHICTAGDERMDASAEQDPKKSKLKQRSETSSGVDPDFRDEQLAFPQISKIIPDLSFVRLKIHHDESFRHDKLAAWACIRLDRLRRGYRLVGLHDATGTPTRGSLLVNIHLKYQ